MQTHFHQRGKARAQAMPVHDAEAFNEDSPLSTLLSLAAMALICVAGIGFKALLLS
jgi:hypothetical protein